MKYVQGENEINGALPRENAGEHPVVGGRVYEGYGSLDKVRILFDEYAATLNMDLGFQGYQGEVSHLPGKYARPLGRLYLLEHDGKTAGCGALRPLGDLPGDACEMKRLYVRPSCRGLGYGKRLARRLIADAVALGYRSMYLDTFAWMEAAVAMYRGLGFREVGAYYDNPFPNVLYFRLDLAGRAAEARGDG